MKRKTNNRGLAIVLTIAFKVGLVVWLMMQTGTLPTLTK